MALDYFILVFVSSIGVYQIVSIPVGLKGLWFFTNRNVQYFIGFMAIAGVFSWFYTSEHRNIQHTVEGSQQLMLFLAAVISAYITTAIMASIIQALIGSKDGVTIAGKQQDLGMEKLKSTTLLGGILSSLRQRRGSRD
ncbi:MAG: hypothetical protein JSW38_05055 [Dehalococcoidia bacterium]|nr:MAG: hypothetical protein JSV02_06610 [Dehalococcoidia bacterium]UCG84186.1 MAG: hypothetical protein JSW38_05055 [Dehalococcoidia bacterium]